MLKASHSMLEARQHLVAVQNERHDRADGEEKLDRRHDHGPQPCGEHPQRVELLGQRHCPLDKRHDHHLETSHARVESWRVVRWGQAFVHMGIDRIANDDNESDHAGIVPGIKEKLPNDSVFKNSDPITWIKRLEISITWDRDCLETKKTLLLNRCRFT